MDKDVQLVWRENGSSTEIAEPVNVKSVTIEPVK
jgi:hypothetical protein